MDHRQSKQQKISDIIHPKAEVSQEIKLKPEEKISSEALSDAKVREPEEYQEKDSFALGMMFRTARKTGVPQKPIKPRRFFRLNLLDLMLIWKKVPGLRPGKKISVIVASLILGILGAGYFAVVVLPRVEVKIYPKIENMELEIQVAAEENLTIVDFEENKIRAQSFIQPKEISQAFQSSGKKTIERKSQGLLTIFNTYSSSPQTLVKGTRFMSENGRLFRSIETVTIPGATIDEGRIIPSQFDIGIIADEAGEDYNIGPATFSIPGFQGTPKYTAFYGKSKERMAGGFRGEVAVVTQEDVDNALKQITSQAKDLAEKELRERVLPSNLKLLEDAQETKIVDIKKPEIGDEKSEFNISVRAVSKMIAFSGDHVEKLINQKIRKDIQPKNKEVVPNSIKIRYSLNKFPDFDKGILDMKAYIQLMVFGVIDETLFKRNLSGKDEQGFRELLSKNPLVERAQVSFWPFWVKKAPKNPDKIEIQVLTP